MAVTHYDLTATFTDLLGTAYSTTSAKVVAWIETNVASSEGIVDEVANSIALGGSRQVADSGGNVTWANLVGSDSAAADINLESGTLQYRVTAEYVDAITRRRKTWVSGWFSLTADIDLADVVAETYVPAAWMTTATALLQTYVDSGQAASTASAAGAQSSAASATLARTLVTSDLGTTDGQSFALVTDPNSQTGGALRDRFVSAGIVAPGANGIIGDGLAVDRTAIQTVLDTHKYVWVDSGVYLLDAPLTVPSDSIIEGPGRTAIFRSTTNPTSGGTGIGHCLFSAVSKTGFRIANVHLDMSPMTTFTSGVRCITLRMSNNFDIDDVTFKTPGAATAATQSYNYRIVNPVVEVASTDGVIHHDGIIDTWDGCHDFSVINPVIYGNNIAENGILITGEDTPTVASPCHNFIITAPRIYAVRSIGIWVNGREGINHTFTISNPVIDGVAEFHGIAIADCENWALNSPVVKDVALNGIRVYAETSQGGVTAGRNGTITSPVVVNANTLLSASTTDGAAIAILSNSDGVVLTTPRVKGATHTYAVAYSGSATNCVHVPGSCDAGTVGKVLNDPAGGTYAPTFTAVANVATATGGAAVWSRAGDIVTVQGQATITPTAAASTATQVGVSLPVPSNLASVPTDLAGTAATQFGQVAAIYADATNDRAQVQFPASATTSHTFYYSFRYRVL